MVPRPDRQVPGAHRSRGRRSVDRGGDRAARLPDGGPRRAPVEPPGRHAERYRPAEGRRRADRDRPGPVAGAAPAHRWTRDHHGGHGRPALPCRDGSDPTRPAHRRTTSCRGGGRGGTATGTVAARPRPRDHRGDVGGGGDDSEGRTGHAALRQRQPRPRRLRPSRVVRHRPAQQQSASHLRRRPPPLRRRPAGPAGTSGRPRGGPPPDAPLPRFDPDAVEVHYAFSRVYRSLPAVW